MNICIQSTKYIIYRYFDVRYYFVYVVTNHFQWRLKAMRLQ
jgi:hypothetical protein